MGKLPQSRFTRDVERHYQLIYQIAAGLLRDPAEAQDVTQETFTQYWQHGEGTRHAKAWLIRVARNRCLDRLRRRSRLEYRDPESLPEPTEHQDALASLQLHEMSDRIRCAVDSLPEPQRSIVVLFSLQGMSGKDCAAALGLSVNQVKVYLHRARARLKGQMQRDQFPAQDTDHGRHKRK